DGNGENPKVDASGELIDGRKFSDAEGFKKLLLADLDRFNAAFVEKLASFALRRAMSVDDRAVLQSLAKQSKAADYKLPAITKAGREYQLSEPMLPLEKHRQDITPISGLHHANGIGQAHVCADSWLTAAKLSMEGGAYHNTVSCDQIIAEVTSPKTRFSSLELSISAGVGQPNNASTLAWSRDGVPLP